MENKRLPCSFMDPWGLGKRERPGLGVQKDRVIGQTRERCLEDLFPRPETRDLRM